MNSSTGKDVLVQRYCSDNWGAVKGHVPFISTGPRFKDWVIPGSLEKHREYRFNQSLRKSLESIGSGRMSIEAIAELFLREGITQALWSVDSCECAPRHLRWEISVNVLADEIPETGSAAEWAIELLSGMSGPEHFRSYLSDDALSLEPVTPPVIDGY